MMYILAVTGKEKEDTLTILERYVDDMEHSDKPALKNILKSLYVEALELV